jgi:hypothetical protein
MFCSRQYRDFLINLQVRLLPRVCASYGVDSMAEVLGMLRQADKFAVRELWPPDHDHDTGGAGRHQIRWTQHRDGHGSGCLAARILRQSFPVAQLCKHLGHRKLREVRVSS